MAKRSAVARRGGHGWWQGGFVREGAIRDGHDFGGRQHDICYMGLVREEWEAFRKRTGVDRRLDRSGTPRA